jgi:light-regulated signal transduction histidine kinase (bacteriophytochrome)
MDRLVEKLWREQVAANPDRIMALQKAKLPKAFGDEALIRQVLSNLLANAVKFTRRKQNAVIEVRGESRDGETVYSVKDNGTGFDMKYYGKLFGVFQRLHLESDYEGTGVGLAIVQRIVHRHGGRIWAESRFGEGATFYFALPVAGEQ